MQAWSSVKTLALTVLLLGAVVPQNSLASSFDYDWRSAEKEVSGELCDPNNRDFDGYRYSAHIPHCKRNVGKETKREVAHQFGIFENYHQFEIDHYIPLSIGGSNGLDNLWPLPTKVARAKSQLEGEIHKQVVAGELDQEQAIDKVKSWKRLLSLE